MASRRELASLNIRKLEELAQQLALGVGEKEGELARLKIEINKAREDRKKYEDLARTAQAELDAALKGKVQFNKSMEKTAKEVQKLSDRSVELARKITRDSNYYRDSIGYQEQLEAQFLERNARIKKAGKELEKERQTAEREAKKFDRKWRKAEGEFNKKADLIKDMDKWIKEVNKRKVEDAAKVEMTPTLKQILFGFN